MAGTSPNVSGGDHAFGLETISDVKLNVANAALTVPDEVRSATIEPVRVQSQKLGDGLWLIAGGSHNSVAVEFRDHAAVIEAPLNEERSIAVIGEVNKLIPNKPIKFVVNTHHHWDHLGGIRTYVHEGATVITHEANRPYYQEVLRARPWTLQPDRFSLSPAGGVVGRLHLRDGAGEIRPRRRHENASSCTTSRVWPMLWAC